MIRKFVFMLALTGCAAHRVIVPDSPKTVTLWDGTRTQVMKPAMMCPKGYVLEWTCFDDYCKSDAPMLTWMCVKQ
jgi:hypothetical protein